MGFWWKRPERAGATNEASISGASIARGSSGASSGTDPRTGPCVVEAHRYDWHACTQRFVDGLVPIRPGWGPRLPHRRATPDQGLEPALSFAAADGRPSWERPTGTVRAQSAFAPYPTGIRQRASARHHSGTRNRTIPGTRSTPMYSPWLAMRRRGVWCRRQTAAPTMRCGRYCRTAEPPRPRTHRVGGLPLCVRRSKRELCGCTQIWLQ